ncbi:copper resistance protein CopC [Pseudoalteromonas sp. NBT06-2]|uniref:copper resistance CopC family protein n=1 Tax=Pseudoalteromonas sp. NBT06-2 TaxID=2025950 RepID=UPI000BA70821|nr:copper resistance CopC family protein [Pseudoalteromonas sp. NBT06-2]PAJ71888.1 copper resistance protein CopC [Pseudoalteromonas sp. NBT06-2]
MKFFNTAITLLSLALTFSASAHVSLKQSTPKSDAMLMQSPEKLSLTFSGDVRLAKVTVKNAKNKAMDINFKPSATPNNNFSWSLPNLETGNYTVKWFALGGDGHKMSESFNFMVHSTKSPSKMKQEKPVSHNKHNH